MNLKLKTKWLKALRGGAYRRGQGALVSQKGDRFCCLGVLANEQGCVWEADGFGALYPIMPRGRESFGINSRGEKATSYLKPSKAGGLTIDEQRHLAQMNDDGKSFRAIADYIEKNL